MKRDKSLPEVSSGLKQSEDLSSEDFTKINTNDELPFDIYTPNNRPKFVAPIGVGWLYKNRKFLFNSLKQRNRFLNPDENSTETDPYNYFPLIKSIIEEVEKLEK